MVADVDRDQMRLVDEDEVAVTDLGRLAVHRLDACEENARIRLALSEPRRIDPGRGLGPQPHHLGVVLGDQLPHMGDDQDALVGPGLENALGEGRHHQALAPGRRNDDERVALVVFEVAVDRRDGLAADRDEASA